MSAGANPWRGEVRLDLDGQVHILRPSFAALVAAEEELGPLFTLVERAAGGLPLRRMPAWLRPIVNWLMPRIGPRGLEFARARVEMKAIETVIHLRREAPAKVKHMVPAHVWKLVERYGIR